MDIYMCSRFVCGGGPDVKRGGWVQGERVESLCEVECLPLYLTKALGQPGLLMGQTQSLCLLEYN